MTESAGNDMSNSEITPNIFDPKDDLQNRRAIYVIDDDADIRKSLHFRLSASHINAWPFSTAADFLEHLPFLKPAPILLDIRMANIDGLQLLAILKERAVSWPVVVLTAHGGVGVAVRAMKLGAIEFLEKPFAPEDLDHAVEQAFAILEQSERLHATRSQARDRFELLTGREALTMAILMEGVPNKEAAHRLCLSVRTVEMHRINALSKLKVKSMAEVVQLAILAGLSLEMKLHSDKFFSAESNN